MKSIIGTLALSLAAAGVLFALATAAQAQGTDQSHCQDVSEGNIHMHFCMMPPRVNIRSIWGKYRTSSEETIRYDGAAEARKAQLRATEYQDPS
jgi:hypothetical protein